MTLRDIGRFDRNARRWANQLDRMVAIQGHRQHSVALHLAADIQPRRLHLIRRLLLHKRVAQTLHIEGFLYHRLPAHPAQVGVLRQADPAYIVPLLPMSFRTGEVVPCGSQSRH